MRASGTFSNGTFIERNRTPIKSLDLNNTTDLSLASREASTNTNPELTYQTTQAPGAVPDAPLADETVASVEAPRFVRESSLITNPDLAFQTPQIPVTTDNTPIASRESSDSGLSCTWLSWLFSCCCTATTVTIDTELAFNGPEYTL